jgi:hypothetical protein
LSCKKDPIAPSNNNQNTNTGAVQNTNRFYTKFTEDWDNWYCNVDGVDGDLRTVFTEDWDNWAYAGGNVRTVFSEDWDNWRLNGADGTEIKIYTSFTEDWDNWTVKNINSGEVWDVRTTYSNDFDNWRVNTGYDIVSIQTVYSDDFDNWRFSTDLDTTYSVHEKMAMIFIPVFTASIYQRGLTE